MPDKPENIRKTSFWSIHLLLFNYSETLETCGKRVLGVRVLAIKFPDWCCSVHIRWRPNELPPSKCSSTSYRQLAGVNQVNDSTWIAAQWVSCVFKCCHFYSQESNEWIPDFVLNWVKRKCSLIKRPCHSSHGQSPAFHPGGLGSSPGQVIWDLWWTKWYWGRFSPSTSVSPANPHSSDYSTFIIIYHLGLVQ
jgi:hypothetical protein